MTKYSSQACIENKLYASRIRGISQSSYITIGIEQLAHTYLMTCIMFFFSYRLDDD